MLIKTIDRFTKLTNIISENKINKFFVMRFIFFILLLSWIDLSE